MGANIGTTGTNTIVALGTFGDAGRFEKSFKGATVHDMLNYLSVFVLLPLELASGYLLRLTDAIVASVQITSNESLDTDLLKRITKSFTDIIIQLYKKIIQKTAEGDKNAEKESLIKYYCDKGKIVAMAFNSTGKNETAKNETVYSQKCKFMFHNTGMSDSVVGIILLILSLIILCACLLLLVKLIESSAEENDMFLDMFDKDCFPKYSAFLSGYLVILVGAGLAILVQSSSVFTSAVTPLIGQGLVSLETFYPLTLGSNIGTKTTGILAALAADGEKLKLALQIALCHLFFNISGIILWYAVPKMRKASIRLAKKLGKTVAKYRWFSIVYLLVAFFFLPGIIFVLSLAGWKVFSGIMAPIAVFVLVIVIINILQKQK